MWRAFFYAVGTMLVILGVQCVLVGRFQLSNEATIPETAKRFISGLESSRDPGGQPSNPYSNSPLIENSSANRGFGGRPAPSSSYGPSRFEDRYSGNDRFFSGSGGQQNRPMEFANYTTGNNNAANSAVEPRSSRVISTEDWMPWSLIAAGAIVLIYTHSFQRVSHD